MDRIQTYDGMQFKSEEFYESVSVRGVRLSLPEQYHQKTNFQVESIMVHAWVSEKLCIYISVHN